MMDQRPQKARVVRLNNDGRVVSDNGSSVLKVKQSIFNNLQNGDRKLSSEAHMLISKLRHQHQQSQSIFGNEECYHPVLGEQRIVSRYFSQDFGEGAEDLNLSNHQRQMLKTTSHRTVMDASQRNVLDQQKADDAFNDVLAVSQFSVDNIEQPKLSDDDEDSTEEGNDEVLDNFIETRMEQEMSIKEETKKPSFRAPVTLPPLKKRKIEAKSRFAIERKRSVLKELSEDNFDEVVESLINCKELSFLIVFREGFTQFRDTTALGSGFGTPDHVNVRIVKENEDVELVKVGLWQKTFSKECKDFFWKQFVVKNKARKLVYDGKAFLNCVLSVYPDEKLPDNLRMIDPIVGCWLLKPDNPVNTFSGAVRKCLVNSGAGVNLSNLGQNNEASIVQQMELLSSVCRAMYGLLTGQDIWPLFYQLEMRVLPALVLMERNGVFLDKDKLQSLGHKLERKISDLQTEAVTITGRKFNLASPKQVREILFDELNLDRRSGLDVAKTEGGVKSTNESVLLKLTNFHPLPGIILQHRQVTKYKTTYVDGILSHLQAAKVFTCWDQVAAATGRVTSVSPNIQAIPKGEIEIGQDCVINIRECFVAPPGYKYLAADFEQIEFRIFGHLSQEPAITSAINEGGDIFRKLASFWLDKCIDSVTNDDRDKTKRVVYALMYGAGKVRLSEILGLSLQQAANIIHSFYTKFSTLKVFHQRIISMAEKNGFLTSLLGRRRYFPHISSSNQAFKAQAQRQAFNFLIQGSAADIAKTALIRAQENIIVGGLAGDMDLVMMIHDEMVWQVRDSMLDSAVAVVRDSLERCGQVITGSGDSLSLNMKVKISVGDTWGTLTPYDQFQ